jgi:energy-coupling factor transporter transmembrane protein EcfT
VHFELSKNFFEWKLNKMNNSKYGLGAANFAIALIGTVFFCLLIGTFVLAGTQYSFEAYILCRNWMAAFGFMTWLLLFISREAETKKNTNNSAK